MDFRIFFNLAIASIIGLSAGYLTDGIVLYKLSGNIPAIKQDFQRKYMPLSKKNNFKKSIMDADILNIDRGIKKNNKTMKAESVSDIKGYKLVGFVSGSAPMALFKKAGKPVAIVTDKRFLAGVWFLNKVKNSTVYLKNKKTGEIKRFLLAGIKSSIGVSFKPKSASSIEKISLKKSAVVRSLGSINKLFNQVNIVPYFQNKKAIGYQIRYLSPYCILRKAGLRVGDVIVGVNGESTTNPKEIMGMYSQLSNMTSVSLDIIRSGKKKTIFVNME